MYCSIGPHSSNKGGGYFDRLPYGLAKPQKFHIIIVQASREYNCFHSTLNYCSVVVGIFFCCPIIALTHSHLYFILIRTLRKNPTTSCFCAIIFGTIAAAKQIEKHSEDHFVCSRKTELVNHMGARLTVTVPF